MHQYFYILKQLKLYFTLLLFLMLASGCVFSPPLEVNPQTLMKEDCEHRYCPQWTDITTPNNQIGMCMHRYGMSYRVNKYLFDRFGVRPRGGSGKYNEYIENLRCEQNGNSTIVDNEYYLGANVLSGDAFLTVDDSICENTPNIFVYVSVNSSDRHELKSTFERYKADKPITGDSQDYKDVPFYKVNWIRTDMTGTKLFRDKYRGGLVPTMHSNYVQAANVIEKQCGKLPESINIIGRYFDISRLNPKRMKIVSQSAYSGTFLTNPPRTGVVHDNKLRAAKVEADIKLFRKLRGQAIFASESKRIKREEQAAKGVWNLFMLMNEAQKHNPCFDDKLSSIDKKIAGCGP